MCYMFIDRWIERLFKIRLKRRYIIGGFTLLNIYRYHRSLEGGTKYCTRVRVQYFISPRGRQPEAEIFSYSTEGPTGPSAIRLFRPRGEDDIVYIHERALLECSCNATN